MKFNSLIPLLSLAFLLFSCNNKSPKPAEPAAEVVTPPIVGNDADEHGCKASAGLTWSVVRQECIAIFLGTIRLNPVDSFLDKNLSAFVVFKSDIDDTQAEIFMPKEKSSLVFDKVKDSGAGTWKHEDLTLTQWKGMYTLEDGDKRILYQGMVGK